MYFASGENILAVRRGAAFTPGAKGALPEARLPGKTVLGAASGHE